MVIDEGRIILSHNQGYSFLLVGHFPHKLFLSVFQFFFIFKSSNFQFWFPHIFISAPMLDSVLYDKVNSLFVCEP